MAKKKETSPKSVAPKPILETIDWSRRPNEDGELSDAPILADLRALPAGKLFELEAYLKGRIAENEALTDKLTKVQIALKSK